ncbi:hypothetical protein Runsl_5612 [Runella slithyformis DSM 19594]|uniref:Uncharacterized protein n=1 Tax=Runella slithyformis (strain ATCC 29530 / DSM 19594 / LMG 11500 / NCIMB 11436 / LSU 4) TaxID=761193 RepID=A0A7U3ZR89_RUNSL|nr:hypothetical protein Runsl_5612 [Runella slithyformis DSM 19594]
MKTTVNKPATKKLKDEYASSDALVQDKLNRASQTLKIVDLSILPKMG